MTEEQIARYVTQGYRMKYGKLWPPQNGKPPTDLLIEFQAFRHKISGPEAPGAHVHFKNIVNAIWNHPKSIKKFDWNPWAERMVEHLCKHKRLAIAGCASSGKSQVTALWALVNFLCAPSETKVILTSVTLKAAKERIWADVELFWQAACLLHGGEANMPGEMVSSIGLIRYKSNGVKSDKHGLTLIAGEKTKVRDSIGKIIGIKSPRVFLIADELPELSESLIVAAESNLMSNNEFQMVGIGNPNSYFDPFGVFSKPVMGWDALTEQEYEWETEKGGYCIRFDAERSPNILAGKTIYPYLMTEERLAKFRKENKPNSIAYYRMVKGFWCPNGAEDSIYCDADIVAMEADKKAIWREPPTLVAGFDPSFTSGGDRSVLYFANVGVSIDNRKTLEWLDFQELSENVKDKSASRTVQIVDQLVEACQKRGVLLKHLAVDGTGAGKPLCDMIRERAGSDFLEVSFGGAASDMPASGTDSRPAKEVYTNKVSEIWFVGREYMLSGQIRGIGSELASELVMRTYETKAQGKVRVQTKADLKRLTGQSPDLADSALLCLELARRRLGMASSARAASDPDKGTFGINRRMKNMAIKFGRMFAHH